MQSDHQNSLSSVPSSTHSVSEGFRDLKLEHVKPSMRHDLSHFETCGIDDLLRFFLSRCRQDTTNQNNAAAPSTPIPPSGFVHNSTNSSPESVKTEKAGPVSAATPVTSPHLEPALALSADEILLHNCLDIVRPICEEPEFKERLKAFCEVKADEIARYRPSVDLFNFALDRLRTNLPGLRSPSDCDILFHVNHPKRIKADAFPGSQRSPDVAIVSLPAAKRGNRQPDAKWSDLAFQSSPSKKKPRHSFGWPDILCFLEYKQVNAPIKTPIPAQYKGLSPNPVPHHRFDPLRFSSTVAPSDISDSTPSRSDFTGSGSVDSGVQDLSSHDNAQASQSNAGVSTKRSHSMMEREGGPTVAQSQTPLSQIPKQQQDAPDPRQPVEQIPPKKARREGDAGDPALKPSNLTIQAGMVQCGIYASEMLSIPGRTHVISMYIVDEVVWVWWFDRQGAIQSDGINLVQDTPRFLVLLVALQRFTIADWGFDSQLIELERHLPEVNLAQPTSRLAPFNFLVGDDKSERIVINPEEVIHQAYCLAGRGTNVLGASSEDPKSKLAGIPLVAKLSWPNASRLNEETIVKTAIDCVPEARDHLPWVIGSFDGYETKTIRAYLDPRRVWKGVDRVHRIVISERLKPITELQGTSFLAAWMECVICHYLLWEKGVQHRDLSVRNLMFRKVDDEVLGVVNDWDLSIIQGISPSPTEHTATIPFLALDLLRREYWEGKVAVKYRHDLESFAWIFIYVLITFENGQQRLHRPLENWQTGNYEACLGSRFTFLNSPTPFKPANGWGIERKVAKALHRWLRRESNNRQDAVEEAELTGVSPPEELDVELVTRFTEVIENALSAKPPVRATDTSE